MISEFLNALPCLKSVMSLWPDDFCAYSEQADFRSRVVAYLRCHRSVVLALEYDNGFIEAIYNN
jgi:hypothetical protein